MRCGSNRDKYDCQIWPASFCWRRRRLWECKCRKQYLYLERCILFVGQKPWQLIWDGAPSHLVQYVQNKIQALSKGAHLNRWHWEIGTQKEAATSSGRCGCEGLERAPRSFQVMLHILNQDSSLPEDHYDLDPSNLHVVWSRALAGLRFQEPDMKFGHSPYISTFQASLCWGEFICSIWFCLQCLYKVASFFLTSREVSCRARVFQLQTFGKFEPSPSKSWNSFNTDKVFL